MKKRPPIANYLLLSGLVVFTVAEAINSYNSGVYADAHGLDGASVGWFAPLGVPVLFLSGTITLVYGFIFLATRKSK